MRQALSDGVVDEIIRAEWPDGVVSVYAGSDPADPGRGRIELKNACARVEAEHGGSRVGLEGALEVVRAGAEDAVAGRSAAAGFVPLGRPADEAIWVDLPSGMGRTTLALDEDAYVLPLLGMAERFGTSGVVTVARDRLAVHEWERGSVVEIERRTVTVDTSTWRDTEGPFNAAAAGRGGGDLSGAQSRIGSDDAHAEKLEAAMIAELAGVAAPLVDGLAGARGWSRLVWFGDPAIVEAVTAAMGGRAIDHVVADDAQVMAASARELADRVRDASDARWARRSAAVMRELSERPPGGRVEAVAEVSTLAREGRVAELFVMVGDEFVADDDHRRINALGAEVVRRGGTVRALSPQAVERPSPSGVVATLRW